jgi:hypothetical protein
VIAKRPLEQSLAGEREELTKTDSVGDDGPSPRRAHRRIAGGRTRGISMRSGILAALMVLMLAAPAGETITEVEPANDSVATAPIQVIKTGPVTTDGGELVLVAGDIDFVGIAALQAGDVVTVTTTPLDDADLEVPDTVVGLFDSSATDPTHMILCRGDDTANNDLITGPGGSSIGRGSLCRFGITAPDNYYVGVTGFRSKIPPACDPAAPPGHVDECLSFPFDGGIGPTPCEEDDGDSLTCGEYQVTIAVNGLPGPTPTATPTATPTPTPTPEPGVLLQLVSGGIGLVWLNGLRNRRRTPSSLRSR